VLDIILRKATMQDIDMLIKLRFDYLAEDRGDLAQNQKMGFTVSKYTTMHMKLK